MTAFDEIHVSLDLETTGLDSARDTIIEVGAVKFRGDEVIDTYQSLINPGRPIPGFVQRLTGISPSQVNPAPFFPSVAADLRAFLAGHPVVGHNISFDLSVLTSHGLKLDNRSYDTWDLASLLLPRTMDYSLSRLVTFLGGKHARPHRALDDAVAAQWVFTALLRRAADLDPGLLAQIKGLASRSRWAIAPLLVGLEKSPQPPFKKGGTEKSEFTGGLGGISTTGLSGVDLAGLASRLRLTEKRGVDPNLKALDEKAIVELLGRNGPFAKAFKGFEYRAEQSQMLEAVANSIYQGRHLVVEGGTGVGKSMAYLLPAVIFAVANGQRVVISTNTINLQEQILQKDIPVLQRILEENDVLSKGLLRAAALKGRGNYLCLRRWTYLAQSDSPPVEDARLLGKTAVWLQDTLTGDRGEINLSGKDSFTWHRISAGDKGQCLGLRGDGACFLRSARERAAQAHVLVVNHSLLLSDLVRGGGLIPDYQYLIVDEAQNLEDEATRQFGFQISAERLKEDLELQGRLITRLRLGTRAAGLATAVGQQWEVVLAEVEKVAPRLGNSWGRLWSSADRFFQDSRKEGDDQSQLLLSRRVRGLAGWSELLLGWENLDVGLLDAGQKLARVERLLEKSEFLPGEDRDTLMVELSTIQDSLETLRNHLKAVLGAPDDRSIDWMSRDDQKAEVTFHAAPLEVGATLAEQLFARKDCVVLTSATLSSQGSFDYFQKRVGFPQDSQQLIVGSPFDYQKAALLLIPEDIPSPEAWGYLDALSEVLRDLGHRLGGRTMALFTSYSSLRGASERLRPKIEGEGIQVLAQGTDGSAQQLMRRFAENPHSVLLGTSSFWEGVDLPSGVLKALVLARLPFQVPTDPIFSARSGQFTNPFQEYAIPQAILKFRQGIGRLIRNKGDKGTIVVLDRRITGRSYGQAFLRSMPPCSLKPSSLASVGSMAAEWIK